MVGALKQGIADAACDPKAVPIAATAGIAPKLAEWANLYPESWFPLADLAAICSICLIVTTIIIKIRRECRETREFSEKHGGD